MARAGMIRISPNIGFCEEQAVFEIEIKGLAEPKSPEAQRICKDDLNEVIASFVQDDAPNKPARERGLFDSTEAGGETLPEELTQLRMGKIVKEKFPELDEEDQEAVRQHAIRRAEPERKRLGRSSVTAAKGDEEGGNNGFD